MVKDDGRCPKCQKSLSRGLNGFLFCNCGWFESGVKGSPYKRVDTSALDWVVTVAEA